MKWKHEDEHESLDDERMSKEEWNTIVQIRMIKDPEERQATARELLSNG